MNALNIVHIGSNLNGILTQTHIVPTGRKQAQASLFKAGRWKGGAFTRKRNFQPDSEMKHQQCRFY